MHIWNELTGDISKKNAFKVMSEFEPGNNIDFNELETKVTYKISWVDSAWLFDSHNFSFTLNYVLDQSHDNSIINVNLNFNIKWQHAKYKHEALRNSFPFGNPLRIPNTLLFYR